MKKKSTDSHWLYWTRVFLMSTDVLSRTTVCQPSSIVTVTVGNVNFWENIYSAAYKNKA